MHQEPSENNNKKQNRKKLNKKQKTKKPGATRSEINPPITFDSSYKTQEVFYPWREVNSN